MTRLFLHNIVQTYKQTDLSRKELSEEVIHWPVISKTWKSFWLDEGNHSQALMYQGKVNPLCILWNRKDISPLLANPEPFLHRELYLIFSSSSVIPLPPPLPTLPWLRCVINKSPGWETSFFKLTEIICTKVLLSCHALHHMQYFGRERSSFCPQLSNTADFLSL